VAACNETPGSIMGRVAKILTSWGNISLIQGVYFRSFVDRSLDFERCDPLIKIILTLIS
jgi:hypothetical protein